MKHPLFRLLLIAVLTLTATELRAQRERLSPDEIEYVNKKWPGNKKSSTGIRYIIQKEGTGASPRTGDRVAVLYRGTLLDGTQFDARQDPKEPLAFRVGRQDVILGWDHILPAMKVGEKRLAIIPGSLAYGHRGRPPTIGRNATLVFEMELIAINP